MALTFAARRLTEVHRLAQVRLGALTVDQMRAIWPLLDPNDLDGSFARWLKAATPIVSGQRSVSARLAGNYLTAFRKIELGADVPPIVPQLSDVVATEQLATSLLVTGPLSIKRAMLRSVPLAKAIDVAETASAATGMRLALDGGRETLTQTLNSDRESRGWRRVTSGNACAYCADREGVLIPDSEVFEAHDGCGCAPEPAY